ncbi:MAG: BlaI/MecI/CopY family transcriptional regulator [Clostridiaceae bacterium]|jgi:BlaI family penicillinase repressor|nr:BlaI/MecI/CopY family transcriptional regulator [Clostridiaceae bacterium]
MSEFDTISDNEWLVMEILWRDGKVKSAAIIDELKASKGWANETVRTFLKRLIAKGVAAASQDESAYRTYWYYATVSKEDYIASQTKGHLKRYYSGRLPQLFAGLLEDESVSDQELNEIENILKRHADRKESQS